MSNVTIAVDTAKNVFEVAISAAAGQIRERRRMTRQQFERFWSTREPCRVVTREGGVDIRLLGHQGPPSTSTRGRGRIRIVWVRAKHWSRGRCQNMEVGCPLY